MGIYTKNTNTKVLTQEETKKEEVQSTLEETIVEGKKSKQNAGVDLTIEEFEYLFSLIKNSTFKGTELEIIYSIILKLQKRYLEKKQ